SDASFVVSVNHLKSKGSPCGDGDDSSEQGNCNITRTRAAQGLAQWLTLEYPNLPVFIIGDLNSYAQEDPIQALINAGFTDVVRDRHGSQTYTYSFRGQLGALDYVMANGAANDMVVFADEWHINAAEPRVLDYSETLPGSDQGKPAAWLNENEFRSSDHDPVVIGIAIE
ncbi:MAG: endonuclease/exonuclease/phosphatase family protein, partial [Pseudomonadota bacterium]